MMAMQEPVAASGEFERLDAISRISESFSAIAQVGETDIRRAVQSLIDSVWHYSFMYYFALKQERDEPRKARGPKPLQIRR